MIKLQDTLNGINIDFAYTPIEMPWGSTYWLLEASVARPVLPNVFRKIGEAKWDIVENTLDAAYTKLKEAIAEALS